MCVFVCVCVWLHSLTIYTMPTKWYMHAEWHKYYVDIKSVQLN